ncbi:hypothetical protein [Streptacidiphilus melanogenes]|uniref:hypothetical protein n=1 Tax=Streptacidiphilus melanogenes TaxID=411235 RepID=UPI0005AA5171|nr:hypothetical protein [Streptacidiphilus melanogenes]
MAVYATVRGWLECDSVQLARIAEITDAENGDFLYAGGWTFPERRCMWTSLVFFGADMRQENVGAVLDRLRAIARIPVSDEDDDRVRGLFVVSHETGGTQEWRVHGGDVAILDPGERYRYLEE